MFSDNVWSMNFEEIINFVGYGQNHASYETIQKRNVMVSNTLKNLISPASKKL